MKNKIIKTVYIMILILCTFSTYTIYAGDINVDDWKPNVSNTENTQITTIAGKILGVIQIFGTITSVITLIILGIKYMCGSIEEKAQYRKSMAPYFIGCILIFATVNIASFIYGIATNIIVD